MPKNKAETAKIKCPVADCPNWLEWLTEGDRQRAICHCGHKIYQNQSVIERPIVQEENNGSTE